MTEFEALVEQNKTALFRFISYKISNSFDADDIYQETVIDAFKNFGRLKNKDNFKMWILAVARNKCNDYYRKNFKNPTVYFEDIEEKIDVLMYGPDESIIINDILDGLSENDRNILKLSYQQGFSQAEIADMLGLPLGTVKSRQATARKRFISEYSGEILPERKCVMKKLPEILPDYIIRKSDRNSEFALINELQGLSIVPELNEKTVWGIYDYFSRKCKECSEVKVVCKAEVHGINGVEIISDRYVIDKEEKTTIQFVAQKTDTHIRYLSESHTENGVKKCFTFLDGDVFMKNWGFGDDNTGIPIKIERKNLIRREDNIITYDGDAQIIDLTGDFDINIGAKIFETVCIMTVGHFDGAIAIEQYVDKNGRTVLWRRFNRDDWAYSRYKKLWSEQLPENEKLSINGVTYVHWYDCITDYIL